MAVVIENPILNSAYAEPTRHFRFDDDGLTDEIAESRRFSSYFVPIPAARRRGSQQAFDTEWTKDRVAENETVNRIRDLVARWRTQGYPGITPTTRLLLEHWRDPERDNRLFFCQVEAAETAIYLTEVAPRLGGQWIVNKLREDAERHNPGLFRVAHKMATGTGKTVLMAMLIAWQTLNKVASPQDARFTDAFLVVTPWPASYTIDYVVLFDRPNLNDQITSGTLTFSDGTSVTFGALPNAGTTGLTVTPPNPVTTTTLKMTVTGVSSTTLNIGLSEIQAWGAAS